MAKRKHKSTKKISYKKHHKVAQNKQTADKQVPVGMPLPEDTLSLQFTPHDTWFFRESRPHDAVGASELASLFPPPIRTLTGALRTHIGSCLNIDWKTLRCDLPSPFDVKQEIGDSEQLGHLHLQGPFIHYKEERLYPAPSYLLKKEEQLQRLFIGDPVLCDLGTIRLPKMPANCAGYKSLENSWLTAKGLRACLAGELPMLDDIVTGEQLLTYESRLGIARNNVLRTVEKGMLYQTRHCRVHDEVSVELLANGLHPDVKEPLMRSPQTPIRLGGEGRIAGLKPRSESQEFPFTQAKNSDCFTLHFITAADFDGDMFPQHFEKIEQNSISCWKGCINEITFYIEGATIGKAHREGGWDMLKHQPRPVKSFMPAGTVWFCRVDQKTDWKILQNALHNQHIGEDSAWGRGHVLLGQWPTTEA